MSKDSHICHLSSCISPSHLPHHPNTHTQLATWPVAAADRPMMRPRLSAVHPAAAPGTADGEHRREQECDGREELSCPTSEMDWREETPGRRRGREDNRIRERKNRRHSKRQEKRSQSHGRKTEDEVQKTKTGKNRGVDRKDIIRVKCSRAL